MKNISKNFKKNVKYFKKNNLGMIKMGSLNVSFYSSLSYNNNLKRMGKCNKNISLTKYATPTIKIYTNRNYSNTPHTVLVMPALSPSMEKGALVAWNKKIGDKIEAGDSLAKVETDKAVLDFDSTEDGYLAKIFVQDGTSDIPLGTPLAIIVPNQSDLQAGAQIEAPGLPSPSTTSAPQQSSTPTPTPSKPKPSNLPNHRILVMPALSPSMEKGALVAWNKKIGDKIEAGDSLAKVETDKAVLDFDSTEDGYLAKIFVQDGTSDIPLGSPLAVIVMNPSDIQAASQIEAEHADSSAPTETPSTPQQSSPTPTPSQSSSTLQQTSSRRPGERIHISPRARVVAKEKGYNVEQITGTGPSGRVILRDVLSHQPVVAQQPVTTSKQPSTTKTAQTTQYSEFTQVEVNNVRRITAERLTQSKQTIPHYYLTVDCNVDKLFALRKTLNEKLSKEGTKVSLNDVIIKASALSMRKVPQVNSHWHGDFIRQYNNVHINVAVDTERGLYVPVVRFAERLGLSEISSQVRQLAEKAKNNNISLEELQGGTFTISNLGTIIF